MRKFFALAMASLVLTSAADAVEAETLYGTDLGNNLLRFDSATPNSGVTSLAISGLLPNEVLGGLDARPANGLLYAIGTTNNRLYSINPSTAAATVLGSAGAFTVNGTAVGFDFNPTVDRIRLVTENDQNLRLNPNDGSLAGTDTTLSPVSSSVVAAAYDRNVAPVAPGALTTLFGIDNIAGTLVRIGGVDSTPSPNAGAVTTVGSLGIGTNLGSRLSFDISKSGIGYAAVPGTFGLTSIYTINLTTGAATFINSVGVPAGVTFPPSLTGLTAAVPEPTAIAALGAASMIGLRRRR